MNCSARHWRAALPTQVQVTDRVCFAVWLALAGIDVATWAAVIALLRGDVG
jgi:hypothetical protein